MRKSRRGAVGTEVQVIGRSLASIARALQRLAPLLEVRSVIRSEARTRAVRKLALSPARRAALKLQGQYMGYLRNLRPRQKTRVKAARTARGIRVAISLAKKLSRR